MMFEEHDHTEDMSYWRDGDVLCDQCDKPLSVADLCASTYPLGGTYLWLQESGSAARYIVGIAARRTA